MRSVAFLPDVWCSVISGYPARCLVLSVIVLVQDVSLQAPKSLAGLTDLAALPDVWCYPT